MLNTRRLILIVALMFCTQAWSDESSDHKAVTQKDQKTEQKQSVANFDTSPLEKAIRESIKEASEKPDAYANEKLAIDRKMSEYSSQLSIYTERLSTFTLWLVIVTAILVYVGARQERHMRDTARRELRGYVALEHIFVDQHGLQIRIRNYGQTPVHQMTIWTSATAKEPSASFNYKYPSDGPTVKEQMLHPQQQYTAIAFTDKCDVFAAGGFFSYGKLIYKDIYDRWWVTRFCYLYQRGFSVEGSGEIFFMPHGQHNCEDGPYNRLKEALDS